MVNQRYSLNLQQTILRQQFEKEVSRIQGKPIEQQIAFGVYSGMTDIRNAIQEIDECTSLIDRALKRGYFRKALHEIIVLKTQIDMLERALRKKNWNSYVFAN